MTAPRFYEIHLIDQRGERRCLTIDLVEATPAELPEVVRAIATLARRLPPERVARTGYAATRDERGTLRRVSDYLWADRSINEARLSRHLAALGAGEAPHLFVVRTGGWAEGADLVGRGATLKQVLGLLESGQSVHLMAPRRYGKTSLMRALRRELSTRGDRPVVRLDVESRDDVASFVVQLVDESFQVTESLRTAIDELRTWPPSDQSDLARRAACEELHERIRAQPVAFLARVATALGAARAVLLIDEFSRFILQAIARQPELLRRALAVLCEAPGLNVLVCGSQGLRNLIDWHKLGPLARLIGVSLDPLERELAAELVEELFYGHRCAPLPAVVDAVLEEVGAPIPYFLHGLVHHVLAERGGAPLSVAIVRRAYHKRLLDSDGNEFFRAYRLAERGYPDVLRRPAARVLAALARSETPTPRDELRGYGRDLSDDEFETLLASLGEDYDIVLDADGARFRSKVMRERWALREAWSTYEEER